MRGLKGRFGDSIFKVTEEKSTFGRLIHLNTIFKFICTIKRLINLISLLRPLKFFDCTSIFICKPVIFKFVKRDTQRQLAVLS
jgi:hypothetical protein